MLTIEQLKKRHGLDVRQKVIDIIKSNFHITEHAIEKMDSRSNLIARYERGRIDYITTINNICNAIDNRILAYYNTDGSINIAVTKWEYFVFEYREDKKLWELVTYKEMSLNGIDIYAKKQLAIDGYDRK